MPIEKIIVILMVEDWLADDLHYNSFGASFYEKHLLADRIRDFGSAIDDLKECYYLGSTESTPPSSASFAAKAITMYNEINEASPSILKELKIILSKLVGEIELVKKDNHLASGVVAILDGISQKALTYKFLVSSESAE